MASTQATRPQRPRASSVLSFSGRSHKSSGSVTKADLVESPKEKMSRRITGKADPSVAINELQPAARALEESTMKPLRSMQHRDSFGNAITDPDQSNPTRPRMERPLDTIRSFEAAIDNNYSRRYSAQPDMQSRRSSSYQGYGAAPRTPASAGGFFDRQPNSRPDSMYGDMNDRGYPQGDRGFQQNDRGFVPPTHDRGHQNGGHYGHQQQRRYPPRNQSDPTIYGSPHAYGNSGPSPVTPVAPAAPGQWTHPALAQASQDTATTSTIGSYGTDHGTNSTDASLHNLSYGELPHQQYNKPLPPPHDAFANGFGQGPPGSMEDEYGQPIGNGQRNRGYPQQNIDMAPPPPPAHGRGTSNGANTLRKQVPLDANQPAPQTNGAYGGSSPSSKPPTEKRKSWLKRRFSKNN